MVALDRGDNRIGFFLKGALKKGLVDIGVKRVLFYQIICNDRSRFSEFVGDNGIKNGIADGESVLAAVFLVSVTGNELEAAEGIFPKDVDGLVKDKVAGDQTEQEKDADPFGILVSSLLSLTALLHLGLAMVAFSWVSKILKTGIQYLPVSSMQTS